MPHTTLVFGNNAFHQLDPRSDLSHIPSLHKVTGFLGSLVPIWQSWACTIGEGMFWGKIPVFDANDNVEDKGEPTGPPVPDTADGLWIWGSDPLVTSTEGWNRLPVEQPVLNIIGFDRPLAYLSYDGHVRAWSKRTSIRYYIRVAVTGTGKVIAWCMVPRHVVTYASLDALMEDRPIGTLSHPLLDSAFYITVFTTESRIFVLLGLQITHLLELEPDNTLRLVEELEGIQIKAIRPGSRNRLAILSEGGDAYLIDSRSQGAELVNVPLDHDEVIRHYAVGSEHEVVVTDRHAWVRGASE